MARKKAEAIGCAFAILVTLAVVLVLYDLLFSKPDHLEGIIIEKIFIPARTSTGDTPYGGMRRGNYIITAQQQEQWIAIVKMSKGDTLRVHCPAKYYEIKNVGDLLHFKKYEGKLFHISYFVHNEVEDTN